MLKFVLDDENLVFGYLDEIGVCLHEVVESIYLEKYPSFREMVNKKQLEHLMDHYSEFAYSEFRDFVGNRADEFEEIEEATGLWGHYSFAIRDLNEEQVKAAEELKSIVLSDLISIDNFPEVD
jgi:hypothetical protein